MNIGLMTGSFNPPHLAHLEFLKAAKNEAALDEIWMAPVPSNPLKKRKSNLPLSARVNLCKLLVKDHDWIKVYDPDQTDHYNREESGYIKFVKYMTSEMAKHYVGVNVSSFSLCGKDSFKILSLIIVMLKYLPNFAFSDIRHMISGKTFVIGPRGKEKNGRQINDNKKVIEFQIGRDMPPAKAFFLSSEDTLLLSSRSIRAAIAAGNRGVRGLPADVEQAYLTALASN